MVLPEIPHFLAGQALAEERESHTCIQLLPQKCQILSELQFMERLQLQLLPPIKTVRVVLQHIPAPPASNQGGMRVFLNLWLTSCQTAADELPNCWKLNFGNREPPARR